MRAVLNEPGFHPHLTPADYFAEPCPAPALTNSGIDLLLNKSPRHFAFQHPVIGAQFWPAGMEEPPHQSSATQYRGSLVHRLALDKGDDWRVIDAPDYRTKEAKAQRDEAIKAGLIPVLAHRLKEAMAMANVIRRRIYEACQGEDYHTEVVIAWQERGVWCRAMLDVWCPSLGLALDIKTAADISDLAINRAFARGYARQAAWYQRGIDALTGRPGHNQFRFLFVEDAEPWLSRTATMSEAFRSGGDGQCDRALAIFADCLARNDWPAPGHIIVTPPAWLVQSWAYAELEDAA